MIGKLFWFGSAILTMTILLLFNAGCNERVLNSKSAEKNVKKTKNSLVLLSDFGLKDEGVSAMKAIADSVDSGLKVYDITHEIPSFDVWLGANILSNSVSYWKKGTVFIAIVDPGVGTDQRSIALKTKSGHYFIAPDNGILTLVAKELGIEEVREIDGSVTKTKTKRVESSHTFTGRDRYAEIGARLASRKCVFSNIGQKIDPDFEMLAYREAEKVDAGTVAGNISIIDEHHGNVWTNIGEKLFKELAINIEDKVSVEIYEKKELRFKGDVPFVYSFGFVDKGDPLVYINSKKTVSLALNMKRFADKFSIGRGPTWSVIFKIPKLEKKIGPLER